jgi:hypothetical protein
MCMLVSDYVFRKKLCYFKALRNREDVDLILKTVIYYFKNKTISLCF